MLGDLPFLVFVDRIYFGFLDSFLFLGLIGVIYQHLHLSFQNDEELISVVALSEYEFILVHFFVTKLHANIVQMCSFDISSLEEHNLFDYGGQVYQILLRSELWRLLQNTYDHLNERSRTLKHQI